MSTAKTSGLIAQGPGRFVGGRGPFFLYCAALIFSSIACAAAA